MKAFTINTKTTVLSSEGSVYKTERFVRETLPFVDFDLFLDRLGGAIIQHRNTIPPLLPDTKVLPCWRADIGNDSFYFSEANSINAASSMHSKRDIVFFRYLGKDPFVRRGDRRFAETLAQSYFIVNISAAQMQVKNEDFLKLYRLSGSSIVNLPLLNETQEEIVMTEDQNMLVQGVAGSGKTNICISKIVYSAGRSWAGRVLYSTFSRGLLADTKEKIAEFNANVKRLIGNVKSGNAVFVDSGKIKAVENKLGVYLDVGDEKLIERLLAISDFLDTKVDYCLIEDLYRKYITPSFDMAGENYFVRTYVKDIKNHQLAGKLSKINYMSHEVIYKEIYGMISGCCEPQNPLKVLSLSDYITKRRDSFTVPECEIIYSLATDYFTHLKKNNLTDNNLMSRELLGNESKLPKYSLVILDEVQDMTEVNLVLFKRLCRKMFCVGDALQMINASYFSFAYLKRLLYEKDISSVAELVSNYRNTKKIAVLAENLGQLNAKCFGVHSFVLKSQSMDEQAHAAAVFVKGGGFLDKLNKQPFNNYTVVVANQKQKEALRTRLKKQEILTVAEIKGLERETIVLHDLVSINAPHWKAFERSVINRKTADENSVYRYYFNLLYVGVSRAKTKLYIEEAESVNTFADFFKSNFETLSDDAALGQLLATSDKTEAEQDELLERIKNFISLGQYDNARFTARQILAEAERTEELNRIDVNERFISKGLHREAGTRYLGLSMYEDARRQFVISGDEELVKLAQSCAGGENSLGLGVVSAFADAADNETVRKIIVGLVKDDLENLKENARMIGTELKKIKESRRG